MSDVIGRNLGDAKSTSAFHIVLLQLEDALEISFIVSKFTKFHARDGLNLVPVTTNREKDATLPVIPLWLKDNA